MRHELPTHAALRRKAAIVSAFVNAPLIAMAGSQSTSNPGDPSGHTTSRSTNRNDPRVVKLSHLRRFLIGTLIETLWLSDCYTQTGSGYLANAAGDWGSDGARYQRGLGNHALQQWLEHIGRQGVGGDASGSSDVETDDLAVQIA